MRHATYGLAFTASLFLSACGGGGSGTTPITSATPTGTASQAQSETAISAANSLGEPMKSLAGYNASSSPQSVARGSESLALNTCQAYAGGGSSEFFSPDRNNDPNSTEAAYFYDSACAQPARDIVRLITSTGSSSENVSETTKVFALNNPTPSATRTDAIVLTNARFDPYGYPVAASGFDRVATGSLTVAGSSTTDSGVELVMLPGSGTQSFCGDSAGYNASGIGTLGETFGWQGGVFTTGTRTVNADGSVTWNATHTGSTVKGAVGSIAIATATQNTACPITTPTFTLTGGTTQGSYTIPTVATYQGGLLVNLQISNATLANGTTLNVTTNGTASPTSNLFITGTIANAGTPIATFNVDAFGDGTLTMTAGGAQYVLTDWHVVK